MANGQRNCILWICCPPGSEESAKALAKEIAAEVRLGGGAEYKGEVFAPPYAVARFILDNFDLAPKGSLQPLKDAIRDYAREGYVEVERRPATDGEGL
jgi:hypothetical protein